MDLLIIDSIQYGHKSIFGPIRLKKFLGVPPQTPSFYRTLQSLRNHLEKNPVSAPDDGTCNLEELPNDTLSQYRKEMLHRKRIG